MNNLPYRVWLGAWRRWPNRKIIHCPYCQGLHPVNELCAAKYYVISEGELLK
jgi:hypothetical protein